jgi:hypothetical protein
MLVSKTTLILSLLFSTTSGHVNNIEGGRELKQKKKKKKDKNKDKKNKGAPATPAPVSAATSAPVKATSAPVKVTSAPVKVTSAPVKATPAPTVEKTQTPTKKKTKAPTKAPVKAPSSSPSAKPTTCPPTFNCNGNRDVCALKTFFTATGGCSWTNKKGWLADSNVCNWYGVSCDANGSVNRVSLYNNKLTGSLPTEVGELVGLTALELGTNQLSGMVPNQIGQLKSLKTLLLDNNNLTGTVPAGVCSLTGLQDFWTDCDGPAAGREITCSCCTACPNHHSASPSAAPSKACPGGKLLKPFKEMYDGAPAFTQNTLSTLGWFTSTTCAAGLAAANAGFKGIDGGAADFIAIKFDAAQLTNVLEATLKMPTSVDVLTALTELTLDSKFKGTTLPDLQKQTGMAILKVSKLGLTGPIPKGAYSKTTNSLTALELSSNSFTGTLDILHAGTIATGFAFTGNKKELKLSKNFGSNLCVDTAGAAINLSDNNIVGPLPTKLCQDVTPLANAVCAAGMTYMNLRRNSFTGTLPWGGAADGVWPKLVTANIADAACTVLNLSSNKISGSVNFTGLPYLSTGIAVASKARNFDFCGNGITNTMPGTICNAITTTATNTASVLYKFETCMDPGQLGGANACGTLCKLC